MSEIKRYDLVGPHYDRGIEESATGKYVLHGDHARRAISLAEELADTQRARDAVQKKLAEFVNLRNGLPRTEWNSHVRWQVQIRCGDEWRPLFSWDGGHSVPGDTFGSLGDAMAALAVMEANYEEHSFRVMPLLPGAA